jgi:hypothetical protein
MTLDFFFVSIFGPLSKEIFLLGFLLHCPFNLLQHGTPYISNGRETDVKRMLKGQRKLNKSRIERKNFQFSERVGGEYPRKVVFREVFRKFEVAFSRNSM